MSARSSPAAAIGGDVAAVNCATEPEGVHAASGYRPAISGRRLSGSQPTGTAAPTVCTCALTILGETDARIGATDGGFR